MTTHVTEDLSPRSNAQTDTEGTAHLNEQTLTRVQHLISKSCGEIRKVFLSDGSHAHLALNALLARGHILLEGVPGVAKTTLASAVSRVIGCPMKRIQFTPDLLPSDIVGGAIFNPQTGEFRTLHGPIFTHVLLADEINRAPAKTQAALLEAMQEGQVTLEGSSEQLPKPFFTIATQNPEEHYGVYPLPEAQLDRFALRVFVDYPSESVELNMIFAYQGRSPSCAPQMTPKLIKQLQRLADEVFVHPELMQYIVRLARYTRQHSHIRLGISPRACLTLTKLCKARALMEGRGYVIPSDIQSLLIHAWGHRVHLNDEARYDGQTQAHIINEALSMIPYHGPRDVKQLTSSSS